MNDLSTAWLFNDNYFDDLAVLSLGPLHPGGFDATREITSSMTWSGMHVLDIGCGTGFTMNVLGSMGAKTLGLEPSAFMRAVSVLNGIPVNSVLAGEFVDAPEIVRTRGPFQAVLIEGVLGFLKDPLLQLCALANVMAQGSVLILSDWFPHKRTQIDSGQYGFQVFGGVEPSSLSCALRSIGYECDLRIASAIARRNSLGLAEGCRRVKSVFPHLGEDEIQEAVARKLQLMQDVLSEDIHTRRYVLMSTRVDVPL